MRVQRMSRAHTSRAVADVRLSNLSNGPHPILPEGTMLRRTASIAAASILALTALSGCGDTPTANDPTTTSESTPLLKEGLPTEQSIIHLFKPKPYEQWLRELKLTEAQARSAKACLESYRRCLKETETHYTRKAAEIRKRLENALREIRQAVEHGTITKEQGRERAKAAEDRARAALKEAQDAARAQVAQCERSFERCIREFLTREQIAKWEKMGSGRK